MLKYSASSPDELALVMGAKDVGIVFYKRTASLISIKIGGQQTEDYETIVEFPFDSTRKRMSLIIKHAGKYFLMTKGADSIMLPRLSMKDTKQMEADLMNFALQGLRTLVFSKRELSENDFKNFMKQY